MSDSPKFRDRKFVMVLYPEDASHAAAIEKMKSGGYNFAAILHDKDVTEDNQPKKPHWHVVVRFKNACWNTAIAKDLGITPNYLEAAMRSAENLHNRVRSVRVTGLTEDGLLVEPAD